MKKFQLNAQPRVELGKKSVKALRKEGKIPAVINGGELVELPYNGEVVKAVVKDLQFQPVKDTLLHIDFLQVYPDKPIVMEVPVQIEGHAEGVKAGGKLTLSMRKLKVKALCSEIPERLVVNVDTLGLGKSLAVGDLHFEGLQLMNAKNAVVCAVQLTRAARGAAAKAEA